jgi:predicted nucleic acid-binding protein
MARRRPKVAVPIVIDASLTASWHFEDERSAAAEAILESLEHDSAYAPLIWWFEIRNVLTLGERKRRATQEQTAAFVAFLSQLPIGIDSLPDDDRVMTLARRHKLTFYDAAYLELAQREGIPLATLDKELVTAARAEGVPLVLAAP